MRAFLRVLSVLVLAGVAAGCQAFAAVASKVTPAPTVSAEFKPEPVTTLVLVENYQNPDLYEVESERLSRDLSYEFLDLKLFPVIASQRLAELRASRGSEFHKLEIPAIARELGAKQVVYVEMVHFAVDPPIASEAMEGKVEVAVRLVDAASGRTLWPRDSSVGRDVRFETKSLGTDTTRAAVEEKLYQKVSDKIVNLFRDTPEEESDVNDRIAARGLPQ
jgi:TolB-like protein